MVNLSKSEKQSNMSNEEQKAKDVANGHTMCGTDKCCKQCKTSEIVNELQRKTVPNMRNET